MADMEETSVPVLAVTAAVGAVVLLLVLLCGMGRKDEKQEPEEEQEKSSSTENGSAKSKKNPPNQGKKQKGLERPKKETRNFTHPWLSTSLKGHSAAIQGFDFSTNGKYLISCAEDRSLLLWSVKEFNKKEHKSIRANVEFDHATKVRFAPDNKAFILSLFTANNIRVMRMGKKADGTPGNFQTVLDFPTKPHISEIMNIGIAANGKFIMTCCDDTTLKIWDLKGESLATINTNQMNNYHAVVSPCGRFVASSGFTPDVKVWEICFDKGGGFKQVSRAFELKGHTSGVYNFSFSQGSTRMATVSKDGTWKLWDTDIEYEKGQDPYLLQTGKYDHNGPCKIALAPDGRTVAIGNGSTVNIYYANTTELGKTISDIHSGPIVEMAFDPSSRYLLTTGDKHIHIFHNLIGYKATIMDLEEKQQKASNTALRERLIQQQSDAKAALLALEEELANASPK